MKNKILAKIDNQEITMEDYMVFMSTLSPQIKNQLTKGSSENKVVKEIVDEIIYQRLLYMDAKENGLDKDEDFQKVLTKTEESLLTTYAIGKLMENINPSDREVEEYYNAHAEKFDEDDSVEASHILVAEKEEAENLKKKLDGGANFEELAKEYSDCPSSNNGGNLGKFSKGMMVKEFEDAAFTMKVGEISNPIKTDFGYHIIKLNSKIKGKKHTLSDVRDRVYEEVKNFKSQNAYADKIKELSQKHHIEVANLKEEEK
ncbi:peptidylprolyl isomerase [Peptoniphilus catoniae]|uniref:peptidylprolyl isomerase n=1 Tax=Peptoniphilus catoniae TaxID=1660341 RepID=UPI0010FDF283|nr:peptidylprolyl isomerase [Peptoniphilus catoniae]